MATDPPQECEGRRRVTYSFLHAQPDHRFRPRPIIIDCVLHPHGHEVAIDKLEHSREPRPVPTGLYSSPSLSTNFIACRKSERPHDTAHALHSRVLIVLESSVTRIFKFQASQFWTPHSSLAFLSASTAALGTPREERIFKRRRSAQPSDT